jgi:hypothetical protein
MLEIGRFQSEIRIPNSAIKRGRGMNETTEIIVGIGVLVAVYILTRHFHSWRYSRAYVFIMDDLKKREAVNPASAVDLPYASKSLFRMGSRDYRPKALEHLAIKQIIGITAAGRYYLITNPEDLPMAQSQ